MMTPGSPPGYRTTGATRTTGKTAPGRWKPPVRRGLRARLLLATVLGVTQLALPAVAAEILGVRVGRHPDMTRLVIDLDRPARFAVRYDADMRLVVWISGEGALEIAPGAAGGIIAGVEPADPAA